MPFGPFGEVIAATAAMAVLLGLGEWMALLGDWGAQAGGLVVAGGFVGIPLLVAHRRRLRGDVLGVDPPLGRAFAVGALAAAAVLPFYAAGFDWWQIHVLHRARLGLGAGPWGSVPEQALLQLGAVAIPEELFFRGYVLGRLRAVWPPARKLAGVPFGLAHVVAAALFAAVHLVAVPSPFRMLVFFPGLLFGWVAQKTGSAVAAAVTHALCNLTLHVLLGLYVG